MRIWAHWTARTVVLAATVAAAGAGFPGAAFAASGGGGGASGLGLALGGNQVSALVSIPASVCGNAAAVLGDSVAGCEAMAAVRPAARPTSARDAGASAGADGTQPGPGGRHMAGSFPPGGHMVGSAPPGLGTLPVTSALSGLPSRPTSSPLTDLAAPGAAGAPPAIGGTGGNSMPASTLTADSSSGMGGVSLYGLAIGALMAGAVALKLAGRRIRGHKA